MTGSRVVTFPHRKLGAAAAFADALAGRPPERFVYHQFAYNADIDQAYEWLSRLGGSYPYLTQPTPSTVRIKAGGNAADDVAGTGARTVLIAGLDENFELISEVIATAGASASSATTKTFSRILLATVVGTGSGRENAGDITIEDSGGTLDLELIGAQIGRSQSAHFTVPAGYTAYLRDVRMWVQGQVAEVSLRAYLRASANITSAPLGARQLFFEALELSRGQSLDVDFDSPIELAEFTDIWFEGAGDLANRQASMAFSVEFDKNGRAPVNSGPPK